tara:strand:- start:266 stop:649 length:384 start_codon:yes stop_codon:yes gene_type:complete
MTTYYLKATSEAALWEALEAASLAHKQYDPTDALNSRPDDLDMEAEWDGPSGAYDWQSDTAMLDIIGTMYTATGTMLTDGEGMEYPEMEAVDGYHANLREELTDEQVAALPIVDAPATPYRIWAGDE